MYKAYKIPQAPSRSRIHTYPYCSWDSDFVVCKPVQPFNFILASSVPTSFKLFWETKTEKRFAGINVFSYFFVKYNTTHAYSYIWCVFLGRGLGYTCFIYVWNSAKFASSNCSHVYFGPPKRGKYSQGGMCKISIVCFPLLYSKWYFFPGSLILVLSRTKNPEQANSCPAQ